jgi:hypothetical protein
MASILNRKTASDTPKRRFGNENDIAAMTGISPRTLQKDRLLKRDRFRWYKVGGMVLYDLDEVEATIRAGCQNVAA